MCVCGVHKCFALKTGNSSTCVSQSTLVFRWLKVYDFYRITNYYYYILYVHLIETYENAILSNIAETVQRIRKRLKCVMKVFKREKETKLRACICFAYAVCVLLVFFSMSKWLIEWFNRNSNECILLLPYFFLRTIFIKPALIRNQRSAETVVMTTARQRQQTQHQVLNE